MRATIPSAGKQAAICAVKTMPRGVQNTAEDCLSFLCTAAMGTHELSKKGFQLFVLLNFQSNRTANRYKLLVNNIFILTWSRNAFVVGIIIIHPHQEKLH